jgi:hypothetical protein
MLVENMKIKKIIKYYLLGESLRDIELDRILEKIGKKKKLSERERNFIELYEATKSDILNDFMLLSKNSTSSKIKELLEENIKIICNLEDKDGPFRLEILDIKNDFESDNSIIYMKGNEKHILEDKYLYNLIYNINKKSYSLETQDEYFEKIEANNNED